MGGSRTAGIENIRENSNFQGVARALRSRFFVYMAVIKIGYLNKKRPEEENLLALVSANANNSELVSDTCHNVLTTQAYVSTLFWTFKTFRLDVAVPKIQGDIVINLEAQTSPNLPDKRSRAI